MTFPEIDAAAQTPAGQTRLKRQLAEQAIAQATDAQWADAAETNRKLLELSADSEAENRLAKALWELGELGSAREHYQKALALGWLVVLAFDVALIALLLGYRLAVMRYGSAADAARSALTYALVIAVAAGATRAIDTPRLLGPVILTLVFYLWDALHGTAPARRRKPRFVLELVVLVVLGVGVIAWNLQLAG